jgi:hypothetical protein
MNYIRLRLAFKYSLKYLIFNTARKFQNQIVIQASTDLNQSVEEFPGSSVAYQLFLGVLNSDEIKKAQKQRRKNKNNKETWTEHGSIIFLRKVCVYL